jgi:phage-related protein
MSRGYLTFNNKDLRDFGVYISGSGVFNAPERVYDAIEIPGRNGVLLGTERRMSNIDVTYPAYIYANFKQAMTELKSFLLSQIGYQKIIDSYYPGEYRLGYYAGGMEVEAMPTLDAGQFELTFNCKPQRYLISGDTVQTLTESGTITNPTAFASAPLLRIYGTGSATVNGVTLTISAADTYTDVDCELMEAYKGSVSRNSFLSLSGVDFPVLSPGENTITLGGGVTQIQITPRWWVV